ncbi:urea-proton symporter DUR3-like [Mizuhopecten yessoensis]|uniref:urea-proton symporter DUR3-like n=1 Tax=Mizuhopecten yessoensis TaxID=6573 RepID=UPI000B45A1CA|nr:urea-proton symporter DUR3-like [Mizuhopecten yessoensis]
MSTTVGLVKNVSHCLGAINLNTTSTLQGLSKDIGKLESFALLVFFGVFFVVLAVAFNFIRKNIYHDKNSLDVAFDAGGKVNIGLTSTTIVSQWTWAATLLQSSTVASKYGISGPFWYAAGAAIQILLFAMISVQLKIKAPGAKTFLQVIKARFGSRTHKTFCVFALMTNIIVTAMLMLGGAAVLTSLIQDISVEYATVLIAAVIGAYTLIGGLGATVYVSYFNTSIIYIIMVIFIMKIYNDPDSPDNPLGTIDKVYTLLNCTEGPSENTGHSYLTILSKPGLMFGLINIVGNFGTVFVDQSYWQCSVAAKPKEGVIGFLVGGICWFAIPFALATTTGLAYIALGTTQNGPLLTADEVDAGLVPPAVAQRLLGRSGEFLIIVMIIMAVTSTGSAEVIAATSILVYDIYQLYLKPYRLVLDSNSCLLCGKARGRMANPRDKCTCESMLYCYTCKEDDKQRENWKRAIKPPYSCGVHGKYREYTDYLSTLKNWCLLWSTISILPLTIFLDLSGVSLAWVYMFMGILIGSAVVPIALSVSWDRLTGEAMMAGSISGMVLAVIVWLSVASTYKGGLSLFLENTGREMPLLCGNVVAISSGGIITVVTSFVQSWKFGSLPREEIWERCRDIDSPLSPWTQLYEKDLNITGAHHLDSRPALSEVERTFRSSKILAYAGGIIGSILLIVVWPLSLIPVGVMDRSDFHHWVMLAIVWALGATIFMIIYPLVTEAWDIHQAFKERAQVNPDMWTKPPQQKGSKPTNVGKGPKKYNSQPTQQLPCVSKEGEDSNDDRQCEEGYTDPNMIDHITEARDSTTKSVSLSHLNAPNHI